MLKISIEALEVIDAIDRKGSFAAAAETLYRVPSALTYTIRKLEEDLNIDLFDRSGHRAILTKAGAELLKEGRQLLNAANALESRVKRVATGVETDIQIALSDLFDEKVIYEILEEFYAQDFGTRIKVIREVFGGIWDALATGRADIAIGAPGDTPSGGDYTTKLIDHLAFVFCVAPNHPLNKLKDTLHGEDIVQYRSIAAADSSRNIPPRTAGILTGQDVLTVTDMRSKLQAQIQGLGVGYLPQQIAEYHANSGQLVIKQVAETKPSIPLHFAWRTTRRSEMGKAQQWLLKRFEQLSLNELIL